MTSAYLTRLHVASALVPVDVVGFVYFSSSAVSVEIDRFWSRPMRFGKTLPSTCVITVLSASLTVYVPKLATKPDKTALASSAVPLSAVPAANLGRSERVMNCAKWPCASNMKIPFGLGPQRSVFLPSRCTSSAETRMRDRPGSAAWLPLPPVQGDHQCRAGPA